MRRSSPIFAPSSASPEVRAGLRLASSGLHDAHGAWLHGAVVVPAVGEERVEAWLSGLVIVAISEKNQAAWTAPLVRQRALLTPPSWEAITPRQFPYRWIAFSVHTLDLFGQRMVRDRIHVHAASGERVSPVIALSPAEVATTGVPEEGVRPGDVLVRAYDAAMRGQHLEAVRAFEVALGSPEVALDLDGGHLYNAACAAARAAEVGSLREGMETRALAWLRDDLARRAAAHTRRSMEAAVRAGPGAASPAAVDEAFHDHLRWLQRDPDLASLEARGKLASLLG